MAQKVSTVGANRSRNVVFGLVLIVLGLVVAALTWVTIFGAVLGVIVAVFGVLVMMRVGWKPKASDPTEGEGRRPSR